MSFLDVRIRVADWVFRALGADILHNTRERAKRVLEESIELAQAEGVTLEECKDLVAYVYARPVGDPFQEAAGVGFCWIAYGEARGFDLLELVKIELWRVDTPEMIARIRHKHDLKSQAGISMSRKGE